MNANTHTLSYAYPTSRAASEKGMAQCGCFLLEVGGQVRSFESLAMGMQCTVARGTAPSRWSIDHPLNQSFFPNFNFRQELANGRTIQKTLA